MVDIHTVWASAGCGKTQFCTELASRFIEDGFCSKEEILYATFAREAAYSAAERAGVRGDEKRNLWFRTLHSTCHRLLRLRHGQIVTGTKMREFGKVIGVEINGDMAIEEDEAADIAKVILAIERIRTSAEDSGSSITKLLAMYQHARLTAASLQELEHARHEPSSSALAYFGHIDWSRYSDVVSMYETWKKSGEMLDFVDMLECVLTQYVQFPSWKVVFIDEAQDLSALQWLVVDKLSERAKLAFYAGDDWQAIMSFQGSSASSFLSYRNRGRRIYLPTTHRFGQKIIDLGLRIVEGLPDGEPKHLYPAKPVDNIIQRIWDVDEATAAFGKKLWLHRHREGCNSLANRCIMRGVPFWAERGVNPLSRRAEIDGYRAISKFKKNEVLHGLDIDSLLKVVASSKTVNGERVKLMKHGSISELSRMEPTEVITSFDLEGHFTEYFMNAMRGGDWSVTDVKFSTYYQALEENGWNLGGEVEPEITITTIHGAKGREADSVFVWDETLPKCLRDPGELRVGYVAVTRAKSQLYIVSSPETSWRTDSFPYPLEGLTS